jgi:hypothetical protein
MYNLYYLTSEMDSGKPRYIGYTENVEKRLQEHIKESKYQKGKSHKINWINKILSNGFDVEIKVLDYCEDLESTLDLERFYVTKYFDEFKLTNSTNGGERSKTFVESVRRKISESLKEYYSKNDNWNKGLSYQFTQERNDKRRLKMGDKISGQNNHFWGKHHSEETRKLLSSKNRKHNYTYEMIFDLYIRQNLTGIEISNRLNIPYMAIKKAIRRYNLKDIKRKIYGKIKGSKGKVDVNFECYFDSSKF